jgi:hypothetical protein
MQITIWFLCVHTHRLLNGFLSRVHNTPLNIKRSKMDSRPPKILRKEVEKKGKEKIKRKERKKKKIRKGREISIRKIIVEVPKDKVQDRVL